MKQFDTLTTFADAIKDILKDYDLKAFSAPDVHGMSSNGETWTYSTQLRLEDFDESILLAADRMDMMADAMGKMLKGESDLNISVLIASMKNQWDEVHSAAECAEAIKNYSASYSDLYKSLGRLSLGRLRIRVVKQAQVDKPSSIQEGIEEYAVSRDVNEVLDKITDFAKQLDLSYQTFTSNINKSANDSWIARIQGMVSFEDSRFREPEESLLSKEDKVEMLVQSVMFPTLLKLQKENKQYKVSILDGRQPYRRVVVPITDANALQLMLETAKHVLAAADSTAILPVAGSTAILPANRKMRFEIEA